jgi:hypothetical protein
MNVLFDDGSKDLGQHGALNLPHLRVLAISQKTLDSQMVLDPLAQQFNIQAAFVQRSNQQGR